MSDVICQVCEKTYEGEGTQALDCACNYSDGFIYGHYGSRKFDMTKLQVIPALKLVLPDHFDPACDACIERWVESGLAEVIDENWSDFDGGR